MKNLISIIGVSRGNEYSPNHVDNDATIFNKVTEELRRLGCEVQVYAEKDFVEQDIKGDVIFDMARDKATIARLKALEDEGALVINSGYSIDNCVRKPMTELLVRNGIPHPQSFVISTADEYPANCYPCWVKRGDSHVMVKEDVSYAACKEEVENILAGFRRRGIPDAVIQEHLQGDLVKFYGVHGSGFFHWFYPPPCSHSKFGLEKINGVAKGIPFSVEELKAQSDRAAVALNVPVYGGDCVILPDGTLRIIDFNDWPSFARCREEAGSKIAEYIYSRAEKHRKATHA